MSQDNLEKGVKEYYQQHSLSPELLSKLAAAAEDGTEALEKTAEQKRQNSKWQTKWHWAIAASFAAIFISVAQFAYFYNVNEQDLILRVAQEVELNHNKQLSSDFISDNYNELAASMNKLDFKVKAPQSLLGNLYQLTGARYCSIQGQIAAQIQLVDQHNQRMTLYITKANEKLAALHNKDQQMNGLTIRNWQEGELFYSLAGVR